jgi:hypothetical protein
MTVVLILLLWVLLAVAVAWQWAFFVCRWILNCVIFVFASFVMFDFNESFRILAYLENSDPCVIFLLAVAFIAPMIYLKKYLHVCLNYL